jgi:hypothetical protein
MEKDEEKKPKSDVNKGKKKVPEKAKNEINFEPETEEDMMSEDEIIIAMVLEGDFSDIEEDHIKPILEELKEALSVTQRMKKRMVMKRYKSKIKIGRKRSMKRRANRKTLQKRAKRQAIGNVKKFLSKGRNLKKASASEKNRLERMVKGRKKLIDRMSRKLVNKKREAERKRFQKNSFEMSGTTLTETFDAFYNTLTKEI